MLVAKSWKIDSNTLFNNYIVNFCEMYHIYQNFEKFSHLSKRNIFLDEKKGTPR